MVVFGRTAGEHISRLRAILDRIKHAYLKLKPSKCYLLEEQVLFLGHIVSGKGISPSPSNVNKILEWKVSACAKEVRQFLGMATYYRRFIKFFAKIAKPLSTLTSKCATFSWNEKCQESFETLKNALTGPEIMTCPLSNGLLILMLVTLVLAPCFAKYRMGEKG